MTSEAKPDIHARTLGEAFHDTVRRCPDRVAVRNADDSVSLTFAQLRDRVHAAARGLAGLGVRPGDTVALLLSNRPEFHVLDLAAVMLRATPFSLYPTLSPEQIEYVVSDAGAKIAVVEEGFLTGFLKARQNLQQIEQVVRVGGSDEPGTISLAELEGSSTRFDVEASWRIGEPDDLLTLIYTSGTTGPPKGVQLSHRNLLDVVAGMNTMFTLPDEGRVISWLPAAHIAERAAHHYFPLCFGFTITCCPNPREIITFLPQVRPNSFFAVPRIWEKIKSGLEAWLSQLPDEQRERAREALQAGIEKVRLEQRGEPVPRELAEHTERAEEALFSKLRQTLGLDEAQMVNVGAAPTLIEVLEFFHAIGIPISEIWGMSETTGLATANPPERIKLGTVGVACPGVEIKLAPDGEVLVRGERIMRGYRNQPEKTRETIDQQGWLATGDIGELDPDGYLRIVDRKKELIINAAGKNMSPANIEGALKAASPLIGQACVIGDRRPYNVALIVLDADFAPAWAAEHGLEGLSLEELAEQPRVREAVQQGVDAANTRLARVEQIKKFHIVPGDWPAGGDELTPTMKLKRKPIAQKYAAAIDTLYA